MVAAALTKASAAAWRRMKPPSTSALMQNKLAAEGLFQKDKDSKLATPTARAPPQHFTGYDFLAPPMMLGAKRMYTSGRGPRVVKIPVRSLRTLHTLDDKLLTLGEAIQKNPLFEKVKGHPLIPDSANAWRITKHGLAFFHSIGLLIFYNNEHQVSVSRCLSKASIRVSSRFGFAEFVEGAKGLAFEDGYSKGRVYSSYGAFVKSFIQDHYPDAVIPEFKGYVKDLMGVADQPSSDEEEFIVFNAALLSPDSAITFTYRADSWLRRSSKKMFRKLHWAVSRDILEKYARVLVGDMGQRLWDITSMDALLSKSREVKKQLRKQRWLHYKLLKGPLNPSQSPGSSDPSQSPGSSPGSTDPSQSPGSSPGSTDPSQSPGSSPGSTDPSQSPGSSPGSTDPSQSPGSSPGSTDPSQSPGSSPGSTDPSQSPGSSPGSTDPSQSPGSPGSTDPSQSPGSPGSTDPSQSPGSPGSTTPSQSSGSATPSLRQPSIAMGDEVLGSQRDLYVHGFDDEMKNDPVFQTLSQGRFFTLTDIAEYQRWKLEGSLPALQMIFLKCRKHSVLMMHSLFEVDRIGNSWPRLPNFRRLVSKIKTPPFRKP